MIKTPLRVAQSQAGPPGKIFELGRTVTVEIP